MNDISELFWDLGINFALCWASFLLQSIGSRSLQCVSSREASKISTGNVSDKRCTSNSTVTIWKFSLASTDLLVSPLTSFVKAGKLLLLMKYVPDVFPEILGLVMVKSWDTGIHRAPKVRRFHFPTPSVGQLAS